MDRRADIARCDAEIAACTEYLMRGGPEEIGAYVGLVDWQRERKLIMQELEPTILTPQRGYASFLAKKTAGHKPSGFKVNDYFCSALFPFQRYIVSWALELGRAAIFAECGLGKTLMQLEWAYRVAERTNQPVLILAPLAVSRQTQREGTRFGFDVTICRNADDVCTGINITNYEMLHQFEASVFSGIVLDESSILKAYSGKLRNTIIESFAGTPYRLACTATPSPNDYMELGNHSEFLGVRTRAGMLATYFNHDGGETSKWRLKGHAEKAFWKDVAKWAVMISKPSDLGHGHDDHGFKLPELRHNYHQVRTDAQDGFLFPIEASSLSERREARTVSLEDRTEKLIEICTKDNHQWLIWGDLNKETDAAEKALTGAVQVSGSDTDAHKESAMLGFADGSIQTLVTKPKIGGFGMNWQSCHQMVFMALSDSYEATYQSERRCLRYGQKWPWVDVHVLMTDRDASVVRNVERKRKQAQSMMAEMIQAVKEAHEN